MKTYQPILDTTITTTGALTANRFVGFDGATCGANAKALGVNHQAWDSGDTATVTVLGIAIIEAGAQLAAGAAVTSGATGKAVAAAALAAAAPVVDDTKLTIDTGATQVTSSAANGAVITAASGFLAGPVLSGATAPVAVNGYLLDAAAGDGSLVRVLLVA